MVPEAIVVLDALPMTPGGKVDRRALVMPQGDASHSATTAAIPSGETETALAALWQSLLDVPFVGRDDNFFALGGHSLTALQLVSRVKSGLGRQLSLRDVFAAPTLSALAQQLELAPHVAVDGPALVRVPRAERMPLSPTQYRLWLAGKLAGPEDAASYTLATAMRVTGNFDVDTARAAMAALVARHEVLRTCYPDDDGVPYARIAPMGKADIEVVDLEGDSADAKEAAIADAMATQSQHRFVLASGPLARIRVLRLSPNEHVVLFAVHHIIADGWAMSVLVGEFATAYAAIRSGEVPEFTSMPVQYVDYADWQHKALDGVSGEALRGYWRDALQGAPAALRLDTDHPRAVATSTAGAGVPFVLPQSLNAPLRAFAQRHGTTPSTVLLASYQAFLHRLTGMDDLVVGVDSAGRNDAALEPMLGFFVNVLPVRSRLDTGEPSFGALTGRTHDAMLGAIANEALPFERIVEASGVARVSERSPLVQTLFVMQNTPRGALAIDGLHIDPIGQATTSSKFDMALFLNETPLGFAGEWVYATDLFVHASIERFVATWLKLLETYLMEPDTPMPPMTPPPAQDAARTRDAARAAKLEKLGALGGGRKLARPAADAAPGNAGTPDYQVRITPMQAGTGFPALIEPLHADLDPFVWAARHREQIDIWLARHGGLLLRGFVIEGPRQFERFVEAIVPELYGDYGDLPKKEEGDRTYRSTPYPEKEMILFHNESSHLEQWPRKQWFYCELPSQVGGATPIVDGREMLRRLPPDVVDRFARLGLCYVRTFIEGLDVPWRQFFHTDSREDVEARCRAVGTQVRWFGDTLQTVSRGPGVLRHPVTGELAFFNQVQLHHPYFLAPDVRQHLMDIAGEDRLPRNVLYGDGTPIDDETMALIGNAYEACAFRFDWQRGDVVMLDNLLVAHARDPYQEPRKIVVAMAQMMSRDSVPATNVDDDAASPVNPPIPMPQGDDHA